MDFSNLKKIFYIVAIISMLLSIKSRVFATAPTTFFNETVVQTDPIQLTDNLSLTPINFTFDSEYDFYNIIVKALPNEVAFAGYGFIVKRGEKLKIKYSEEINGIPRAYPTLVFTAPSGVDYISFNVSLDSNLQNVYDNRMSNFSTSTISLNSNGYDITFSGWTKEQFRQAFPNNILYSSNCNIDFYYENNKVGSVSPFIPPSFDNVTEIENGNPDGVFVSAGDFTNTDNLYFHLLRIDTGLSNSDQSIYYYSDKTFLLNKDSDYYRTWDDPSIDGFYYYIPRYKLGLSQNTSYLYVLNNSKNQIQNSQGIYEKDVANGIYDVLQSDTAGVISATEEQSDRLHNIEVQQQEALKDQKKFQDTLTDTNIQNTTENDVDTSLNYSSDNQQLNNVFTGFFSRLSSWLSQFLDYDITQDTTLNIPIPYSEETITLHSNTLYNQLHNTALYPIIYAFYMFIFMTNLVLFYTKVYAKLVTGGYLNSLKNPITETGIDKTIL